MDEKIQRGKQERGQTDNERAEALQEARRDMGGMVGSIKFPPVTVKSSIRLKSRCGFEVEVTHLPFADARRLAERELEDHRGRCRECRAKIGPPRDRDTEPDPECHLFDPRHEDTATHARVEMEEARRNAEQVAMICLYRKSDSGGTFFTATGEQTLREGSTKSSIASEKEPVDALEIVFRDLFEGDRRDQTAPAPKEAGIFIDEPGDRPPGWVRAAKYHDRGCYSIVVDGIAMGDYTHILGPLSTENGVRWHRIVRRVTCAGQTRLMLSTPICDPIPNKAWCKLQHKDKLPKDAGVVEE